MQKSNWKKCKLNGLLEFNPKAQLKKGSKSKKVDMDKLEPFTRKITGYIEADFTGGSKFTNGDTLLARITPCLENGKTAYVDVLGKEEIGFGSTEFIVLRAIEGISDPLFVYYLAVSPDFRETAIASMSGTSGRQRVDIKALAQLEINLAPLEEQKRIAEVLGAFDDKIELLQKQNKTLEDMAKALFKCWFVDFSVVRAKQKGLPKADIMREYHLTDELYDLFPSSFADSPLGPIPSGWEVKTIQDLGEVVCGKTPSTSHKEYYGGSMPFITIPDMHNSIFANKTERYLTSQGEQAQPTKTLPPFSVCVSCIATPGLVTMTTTNSQTNQQINSVIPHNLEAKFYNYYVLRSVADQIRAQGSGGSVFVNLNKTAFSKIKVLLADQSLQKLFTKESESYFNKILNNLKQIQTLTELRDTLLPRLISGKIRV